MSVTLLRVFGKIHFSPKKSSFSRRPLYYVRVISVRFWRTIKPLGNISNGRLSKSNWTEINENDRKVRDVSESIYVLSR